MSSILEEKPVSQLPKLAARPAHVPENLVREFDYIHDAGLLTAPHARMCEIAHTFPPIFWTPCYGGHWVVRGRRQLAEVTTNPERFSSKTRGIPPVDHELKLIPLTFDPPEHSAYRIPVNPLLSVKGVAHMEEGIRAMADDLIDRVLDKGGCNFLHEVAEVLPVTLFMKMAGMPTDRITEFRQISEQATAAPSAADRAAAFARITEILAPIVKTRMESPGEDLVSRLYTAGVSGRMMSFDELLNYSMLLFLGGLETVVNVISFSTIFMARNPEIQADLRENPEKLPHAIDEFLRLHGIVFTARRVTQDLEIDGVRMAKDDPVMLATAAANYDPEFYTDPKAFNPGRKESHVTFNMGPHRCMGANLGRLELRVFFEQWLKRVPPFRLDAEKTPTFIGGLNIAVRTLDVRWD